WARTGLAAGTNLREVAWGGPSGKEKFVAVGIGVVLTSPDGQLWSDAPPSGFLTAIMTMGGRFYAVGSLGDNPSAVGDVLVRDGGLTRATVWEGLGLLGHPASDGRRFLVPSAFGFLVSGEIGSTDWAVMPVSNLGLYSAWWLGPAGSERFVALGDAGTILSGTDPAALQTESHGFHYAVNGVIHTSEGFFAAAELGTVLSSVDGVVWKSVVAD